MEDDVPEPPSELPWPLGRGPALEPKTSGCLKLSEYVVPSMVVMTLNLVLLTWAGGIL